MAGGASAWLSFRLWVEYQEQHEDKNPAGSHSFKILTSLSAEPPLPPLPPLSTHHKQISGTPQLKSNSHNRLQLEATTGFQLPFRTFCLPACQHS